MDGIPDPLAEKRQRRVDERESVNRQPDSCREPQCRRCPKRLAGPQVERCARVAEEGKVYRTTNPRILKSRARRLRKSVIRIKDVVSAARDLLWRYARPNLKADSRWRSRKRSGKMVGVKPPVTALIC